MGTLIDDIDATQRMVIAIADDKIRDAQARGLATRIRNILAEEAFTQSALASMVELVSQCDAWSDTSSELLINALTGSATHTDKRKQKLVSNFELFVPSYLSDIVSDDNTLLETKLEHTARFCVEKLELRNITEVTAGHIVETVCAIAGVQIDNPTERLSVIDAFKKAIKRVRGPVCERNTLCVTCRAVNSYKYTDCT
jgi:hypothetical protein